MFVLIHSPLLGKLTWQGVAEQLQKEGYEALTPELTDNPHSNIPLWQQEVENLTLPTKKAILVGHSGAGALLPAIGEKMTVQDYIFVDAVLLFKSATRLELLYAEDAQFAQAFERHLQTGGQFPDWKDEQLQAFIPAAELRQKLLAEVRPRSLNFFTEQIEAPDSWDTKPCAYIQLSESYTSYAAQAEMRQWPVLRRSTHHFEMLTNPTDIAQLLIQMRKRLL